MTTYVYFRNHYSGILALDKILTELTPEDSIVQIGGNMPGFKDEVEVEVCSNSELEKLLNKENIHLVIHREILDRISRQLAGSTTTITLLDTSNIDSNTLALLKTVVRLGVSNDDTGKLTSLSNSLALHNRDSGTALVKDMVHSESEFCSVVLPSAHHHSKEFKLQELSRGTNIVDVAIKSDHPKAKLQYGTGSYSLEKYVKSLSQESSVYVYLFSKLDLNAVNELQKLLNQDVYFILYLLFRSSNYYTEQKNRTILFYN